MNEKNKYTTLLMLGIMNVLIPLITMAIYVMSLSDEAFLTFLDVATIPSRMLMGWLFAGLVMLVVATFYWYKSEKWMIATCEICGKKFRTLTEDPLKICGDCAFEIGDKGIAVLKVTLESLNWLPITLKEALKQLDKKLGYSNERGVKS